MTRELRRAAAAGCRMEREPIGPEYSDLRTNPVMIDLYRANSEALGRPVYEPTPATRVIASRPARRKPWNDSKHTSSTPPATMTSARRCHSSSKPGNDSPVAVA